MYAKLMHKLSDCSSSSRHRYTSRSFKHLDKTYEILSFPFLQNVQWLLQNDELMENANFSYDSGSENYHEMNTGDWWHIAEVNMTKKIDRLAKDDEFQHKLIPIIIFVDKTHVTTNGRIKAEPILCSIGNINMKNRIKRDAWFCLGYIPQQISISDIEEGKLGIDNKINLANEYMDYFYV